MICVCIREPEYERCKQIVKETGTGLAEIRMDTADLSADEIGRIFSIPTKLIATCRPSVKLTDMERIKRLTTAIVAGASYLDIEIDSDRMFKDELIRVARIQGCNVIISFHDYEKTPPLEDMARTMEQCFFLGADIAKISCMVNVKEDNSRILALYDILAGMRFRLDGDPTHPHGLVAVGMGEKGVITRVAAPFLGAPFTFASPNNCEGTAPGQPKETLLRQVFKILEKPNE